MNTTQVHKVLKRRHCALFEKLFGTCESYKPHENLKQRKSTSESL